MDDAARRLNAPSLAAQWHTHLPAWIEHDKFYCTMPNTMKFTLQQIANAPSMDLRDDGSLLVAFGGRQLMISCVGINRTGEPKSSTFWRHIKRLQALGFIVLLKEGGMFDGRTYGNQYGIPGRRGGLDHREHVSNVRRMLPGDDGKLRPQVIPRGDQIPLWHQGHTQSGSDDGGKLRPQVIRPDLPGVHRSSQESNSPLSESQRTPSQNGTVPPPKMGRYPLPKWDGNHHVCMYVNHGARTVPRTPVKSEKGGFFKKKDAGGMVRHLQHLRIDDLHDMAKLLQAFEKAISRGLLSRTEENRIRFVSAAEHALRKGKNACGLFAYIVNGQRWLYVTQDDYLRANARLKEHLYGVDDDTPVG